MRDFFTNTVLFTVLAIAFSGLSACTDIAKSQKGPVDEAQTASSKAPNNKEASKKLIYPPIATAVAEADLKNLDGTTFKVADKKGKVLLLNMWATWCGPCRSEMPSLVKMQEAHRDNGLEVIGLNTDDESLDQINSFSQEMKLNYTLVWADAKLQTSLLNISKFAGIPQSFVIDRDGSLRGVFRGANHADIRKLEELVAKVVSE